MPASNRAKISSSQQPYVSYGWTRMYQQPLLQLVKDREVTSVAIRAYLAFVGLMDFSNRIQVTQKALANMVGTTQPHVSEALKILEKKGVISREVDDLGIRYYSLSERYCLKGDIRPRAVR